MKDPPPNVRFHVSWWNNIGFDPLKTNGRLESKVPIELPRLQEVRKGSQVRGVPSRGAPNLFRESFQKLKPGSNHWFGESPYANSLLPEIRWNPFGINIFRRVPRFFFSPLLFFLLFLSHMPIPRTYQRINERPRSAGLQRDPGVRVRVLVPRKSKAQTMYNPDELIIFESLGGTLGERQQNS